MRRKHENKIKLYCLKYNEKGNMKKKNSKKEL